MNPDIQANRAAGLGISVGAHPSFIRSGPRDGRLPFWKLGTVRDCPLPGKNFGSALRMKG